MRISKKELERFLRLGIADDIATLDRNLYCNEYDVLAISRNSVGTRSGVLIRFNDCAPEDLALRLFVAFGSDAYLF